MDVCPKCRSTEIASEDSVVVCQLCGHVLSESNITVDVTFAEGGDGMSSVVGQFVSSSGTGMGRMAGRGLGGHRAHREITLSNGRRRLMHLASALKLSSQHVDSAHRFFSLAVQHNFTQGRRTPNVIAACLYIVCRRNQTPHMLIDFSDVLQMDMFAIGSTFYRLCELLDIRPPLIDPSLYIHRFAAQLDFKEKEQEISATALRLVQRMKRDWIQTGRRPAGVCGAALYIAAKLYEQPRSKKEIIETVKICEMTLRRRVTEFLDTEAGQMSLSKFTNDTPLDEDYMTKSYSSVEEPPISKLHRRKRARLEREAHIAAAEAQRLEKLSKAVNRRKCIIDEDTTESETESEAGKSPGNEDEDTTNGASRLMGPPPPKRDRDLFELLTKSSKASVDNVDPNDDEGMQHELIGPQMEAMLKASQDLSKERLSTINQPLAPLATAASLNESIHSNTSSQSTNGSTQAAFNGNNNSQHSLNGNSQSQHLPISSSQKQQTQQQSDGNKEDDDGDAEMSEDELKRYIVDPTTVAMRNKIWEHINKDWLDRQKEIELEREIALRDGKPIKKRGPRKVKEAPVSVNESPSKLDTTPTRTSRINWDQVETKRQEVEPTIPGAFNPHEEQPTLPASAIRALQGPSAFLTSLKPTIPTTPFKVSATTAPVDTLDFEDDMEEEEAPALDLRAQLHGHGEEEEFDDYY